MFLDAPVEADLKVKILLIRKVQNFCLTEHIQLNLFTSILYSFE